MILDSNQNISLRILEASMRHFGSVYVLQSVYYAFQHGRYYHLKKVTAK